MEIIKNDELEEEEEEAATKISHGFFICNTLWTSLSRIYYNIIVNIFNYNISQYFQVEYNDLLKFLSKLDCAFGL